jgi:RNA polymerase sigma factor (sigma-70 family)
MPEDTNQPIQPGVRYTGPQTEAHIVAWNTLCDLRTKSGKLATQFPPLNLLNDLAFTAKPTADLLAGLTADKKHFKDMKTEVETIAALSSDLAGRDKAYRVLHYDLTDGLVSRWVAFREEHPVPRGVRGQPAGLALLADLHGGFLYGVIRMAHDFTMRAHADKTVRWGEAQLRIDKSQARDCAENEFRKTLMGYKPNAAPFNTLLTISLKNYLMHSLSALARRLKKKQVGRDNGTAVEALEDQRSTDPAAGMLTLEDEHSLRAALSRLRRDDRELLEQRFGLNGTPPRSVKEIAKENNVSDGAISLRVKHTLKLLRGHLSESNDPPSPRSR